MTETETHTSDAGRATGTWRSPVRWLALEIAALLCVVVATDQLLSAALKAVRPPDHRIFLEARQAIHDEAPDILVLGDSHIADAYVPEIVRRQSGLSSLNFGVYSSGPLEWEVLARDLFAHWTGTPQIAVIGASPAMFHRVTSGGRYSPELVTDPVLRLKLLTYSGLSDDWLLLLSSYRQRHLIPALVRILSGQSAPSPIRQIEGVDRGYLRNVLHMRADASFESGAYLNRVNPAQVAAFRALLDLLDSRGIRTIIVDPPVEPRHLSDLLLTPRYIEFDRTLNRVLATHGISRINFRTSDLARPLDYRDFLNAEHLCASGAAYFSTFIGAWINET